jgi:uncharacterized integral membrane protein (TIGR00698 family)
MLIIPIFLYSAVVAAAFAISAKITYLSPLFLGLLFGMALGQLPNPPLSWGRVRSFVSKYLMRTGVALLGLQISFHSVGQIGWSGFASILIVVALSFTIIKHLAPKFGINPELATLIAGGFSICGVSAISAIGTARGSKKSDISYASGVVTLCGTLSIFLIPPIARLLDLSQTISGSWIGAAVHDVGQVVATATLIGGTTIHFAIITKLARVVLLAPMLLILTIDRERADAHNQNRWSRLFRFLPGFVLAFLLLMIIGNSYSFSPHELNFANTFAKLCLTAGLFAMAMGVKAKEIAKVGSRPLLFGLVMWIALGAISLGVVTFLI